MKKALILVLPILLVFPLVSFSVVAAGADPLTADEAYNIFWGALECLSYIQNNADEHDYYDFEFIYDDHGGFTIDHSRVVKFTTSTDGKPYKDNAPYQHGSKSESYLGVRSDWKYQTTDDWLNYARMHFTEELAQEMTFTWNSRKNYPVPIENFRYDDNGKLVKYYLGYGAQAYPNDPKYFVNYRDYRCAGDTASFTLTKLHWFTGAAYRDFDVVLKRTESGWRLSECSFIAYSLGDISARGETSPETGDGTAARAAVFTVGAVLAAAVPALILTVKHRRKEK